MRGAIVLALALAACEREPDFDERYEAAEERIAEISAQNEAALDRAEREDAQAAQQAKP